jgi:hypothetical protein
MRILVVAVVRMDLRVAKVVMLGIQSVRRCRTAVLEVWYSPKRPRIGLSWVVAVGPEQRTIPLPT